MLDRRTKDVTLWKNEEFWREKREYRNRWNWDDLRGNLQVCEKINTGRRERMYCVYNKEVRKACILLSLELTFTHTESNLKPIYYPPIYCLWLRWLEVGASSKCRITKSLVIKELTLAYNLSVDLNYIGSNSAWTSLSLDIVVKNSILLAYNSSEFAGVFSVCCSCCFGS